MDSSSNVHKLEYRVRELPTRSVTLFASRAQVVRDIKNVPLKSGSNEITIVGLTPTIDEQSIKVEGTGSAIITDIAVESLPNREIFEEIYPESDSDDSSDSESGPDLDEIPEPVKLEDIPEGEALEEVRSDLVKLRDERRRTEEVIASTESRQKWLDSYYKTLADAGGFGEKAAKEINVGDAIGKYDEERKKVFQIHMDAKIRKREIDEEIADLVKQETKLNKARQKEVNIKEKERQKLLKARTKALRVKAKEKEKERRKEAEKTKEKLRIRKERESFWPKSCFTVRIKLDAVDYTPMSSRRSSFAGDLVKVVPEKPTDEEGESGASGSCDLSLSYVTAYAYWSPKYDLQLSTTNSTGLLCFDAELTNLTSETWSDCKVTLSTSQTTTSSLNELIPTLIPWHVKLAGRHGALGNNFQAQPNGDILDSREERGHKSSWKQRNMHSNNAQKPRRELFGPQSNNIAFKPSVQKGSAPAAHFGAPQQPQQASHGAAYGQPDANATGDGLFGTTNRTGGLFGNINTDTNTNAGFGGGLFGAANAASSGSGGLFPGTSEPVAAQQSSLFGGTRAGGLFANTANVAPSSSTGAIRGGLFGNYAPAPQPSGLGGLGGAPNSLNNAPNQNDSTVQQWTGYQAAPAPPGGLPESSAVSKKKSLFASSRMPVSAPNFGSAAVSGGGGGDGDGSDSEGEEEAPDVIPETDELTLNPNRELDFQESSFEETGLTTTYDLPGSKTLAPSPTASKQRVARIQFASVLFSHTVVAKYRPAAYLKAKMKNGSKITLLKGPTGLTLDGSFMGRTTLPRCSAGESFTLPLGIDPAIRVAYPKPDVQRLTTGFFAKEDSSIYTRTVTLANTRASAGKPVNVLVLDQIPVSEDEKLRVEVLSPKGMGQPGSGSLVPTGTALKDGGDPKKDWGKATAQLKKDGQVAFEVSLNAGKAVKLVLEYGVALPTGEKVTQC